MPVPALPPPPNSLDKSLSLSGFLIATKNETVGQCNPVRILGSFGRKGYIMLFLPDLE